MPGLLCSVLTACLCTIPAASYRNQTVRLSAALRAGSDTDIRFSVAADGQPTTVSYRANATRWIRAEATLPIGPDAEVITVTITPAVQVKDLAIVAVPFADNPALPTVPEFPANEKKGCLKSSPCSLLSSKGPSSNLQQTVSAAPYRGHTVRFRAALRLQASGTDHHARLFLRTGRGDEPGEEDDLDYREVRSADWTTLEIVRKIDEDATSLSLGVMLMGKGRAWLDEPTLTIDADTAPAPAEVPLTEWPSLPRPSVDEQRSAVNAASRHALTYVRDLPNFLCTLQIRREENIRNTGWRPRDTLSVQLGFAEKRESYKLLEINSKRTTMPYRAAGGALSEGDYGSLIADIFRPGSAQFAWDHWAALRGRVVHVFRYRIGVAKSEYQLHVGNAKGAERTTVSAHHGFVSIDRETSRILKVEQVGDPPKGFPILFTGTTIDYDWNTVGGKVYLLPLHAEVSMGTANLRSLNSTLFRDYRRFGADTQITFEPEPAAISPKP